LNNSQASLAPRDPSGIDRKTPWATGLAVLCVAFAVGCGDDPVAQFDLLYQVRCDVAGGCAAIPPRDINQLAGAGGFNLDCSVAESGGNQLLQVTAKAADNSYGIELRNVSFPPGGGPVGPGCRATVYEDGNRYEATCSAAQPAGDCLTSQGCEAACRIYDVVVSPLEDDVVVSMNFYCQGLFSPALGRGNSRELTAPGGGFSGEQAPDHPAMFALTNCTGLVE
jgi:hypothetical protein